MVNAKVAVLLLVSNLLEINDFVLSYGCVNRTDLEAQRIRLGIVLPLLGSGERSSFWIYFQTLQTGIAVHERGLVEGLRLLPLNCSNSMVACIFWLQTLENGTRFVMVYKQSARYRRLVLNFGYFVELLLPYRCLRY